MTKVSELLADLFKHFFWEQLAIFGKKILQDTYMYFPQTFVRDPQSDFRGLRFSVNWHREFWKKREFPFSNTSRQVMESSFWRWIPLLTWCVGAQKIVEHHRTTSRDVFHTSIVLPQMTTIQHYMRQTHSNADRDSVLATFHTVVALGRHRLPSSLIRPCSPSVTRFQSTNHSAAYLREHELGL